MLKLHITLLVPKDLVTLRLLLKQSQKERMLPLYVLFSASKAEVSKPMGILRPIPTDVFIAEFLGM